MHHRLWPMQAGHLTAPLLLLRSQGVLERCRYVCIANVLSDAQVNVTSSAALGGWISASPINGSIAPGESQVITLSYDVSQNEFQGMYEADILITTDAQPLAKVDLRAILHAHHYLAGPPSSSPFGCICFAPFHEFLP